MIRNLYYENMIKNLLPVRLLHDKRDLTKLMFSIKSYFKIWKQYLFEIIKKYHMAIHFASVKSHKTLFTMVKLIQQHTLEATHLSMDHQKLDKASGITFIQSNTPYLRNIFH